MVNYKEFDKKPVQSEQREKMIIGFLFINPMTIKELVENTGLLYHQVQSCLLRLRKTEGKVSKKRFGKKTYYGVIKKLRTFQSVNKSEM